MRGYIIPFNSLSVFPLFAKRTQFIQDNQCPGALGCTYEEAARAIQRPVAFCYSGQDSRKAKAPHADTLDTLTAGITSHQRPARRNRMNNLAQNALLDRTAGVHRREEAVPSTVCLA